MERPYIAGWVDTAVGEVPQVSATLSAADRWGGFKAAWSVGRMDYKVDPGLYALGSPGRDSRVFVSANYKVSFDSLRRELGGLDAWILVLDTKGINVWCASGKGTFGTGEMVHRIELTRLAEIVDHRKLIVPQLGAPGVAAHSVRQRSGFSVIYGPVRACDIKAFLEAGLAATPEMRRVRFSLRDRLRLVPVELVGSLKYLIFAAAVFLLLAGIGRDGYSSAAVLSAGPRSALNLLLATLAGVLLGPALLPWLPGRSFSFKGAAAGLGTFLISFFAGLAGRNPLEIIAWALLMPAIASFLTMNFTGASTFTSLSGVRKEMRLAVPLQLALAVIGVGAWTISRFLGGRM